MIVDNYYKQKIPPVYELGLGLFGASRHDLLNSKLCIHILYTDYIQ